MRLFFSLARISIVEASVGGMKHRQRTARLNASSSSSAYPTLIIPYPNDGENKCKFYQFNEFYIYFRSHQIMSFEKKKKMTTMNGIEKNVMFKC